LETLAKGLNQKYLSLESIAQSVVRGAYQNMTSFEIDILASETAASMSTQHPDYARLAARICVSHNHKITPDSFSENIRVLYDDGNGFISPKIAALVRKRGKEIDDQICHERDMDFTYFGFKTLEKSYLLKTEKGKVVERPQYMLMRVALGIHCCGKDDGEDGCSEEEETKKLKAAFETYDMMSRGFFTHASPTLFHSGTIHPQLSSCVLVQMSEDSINGIYDTLKRCAVISKVSFAQQSTTNSYVVRVCQSFDILI
jgi:ribonucleotide reductase alpha subunit